MRMTKVDANNVRNECPYQIVLAILDELQWWESGWLHLISAICPRSVSSISRPDPPD